MLTGTEKAMLNTGEYVLGTYEEIEKYAEEQDTCVDRYLDHVNPSCVTSKFKYVGTGVNPYAVAKPVYINEAVENNMGQTVYRSKGMRVFKEKF